MGQSGRVRLRDLRAVYRLIGECRERKHDPIAWRRHMLEGLCPLVGAQVGCAGEGRWTGRERVFIPAVAGAVDIGWAGSRERELWLHYMQNAESAADPVFLQLAKVAGRLVTRVREQLIDDGEWYDSEQFNEYRKLSDVDHFINSFHAIDGPDHVNVIGLFRAVGDPPFSLRERRLVHLFHHEMGPLVGPVLRRAPQASPPGLSPRLQQTLENLLQGASEKQIAARLGIGRSTVHQYVNALYRHFGVHSRTELLVHWMGRTRSDG